MQLLEEGVLVLNSYYLATHVTTAKDAVMLLVTEKAEVIDENYRRYTFEEWANHTHTNPDLTKHFAGVIQSPSLSIFVPYVIRLTTYDAIAPHLTTVRYSRKNIYERDEYTCQYCERKLNFKDLTVDHIVPRSKGGTSTWTNVVAACRFCNNKKGSKTLDELGWKLRKSPKQPKWKSYTGIPFHKTKKDIWERFLK